MAYHLQTNNFSKHINQTMEIALKFFVYAIQDPFCQPKVLLWIQSLLNNIFSSIIKKTPNEIAYDFSPRLLDLILAMAVSNTCVACINTANGILFTLFNQKKHYNRKHKLVFIKVGNWAILRFYKDYSIPSLARVTKKLNQ